MTTSSSSDFLIASAISAGLVSHDFPILVAPSGRVMTMSSRGFAVKSQFPVALMLFAEMQTSNFGLVFGLKLLEELYTVRNVVGLVLKL